MPATPTDVMPATPANPETPAPVVPKPAAPPPTPPPAAAPEPPAPAPLPPPPSDPVPPPEPSVAAPSAQAAPAQMSRLPHFERIPDSVATGEWAPVPLEAVVEPPPPKPDLPIAEDEDWIRSAINRRGNPTAAAFGWGLVLVGVLLLIATFYWGYLYGDLFAPAGIRGDFIAYVLIVIGFIIGVTTLLIPQDKPDGLAPEASQEQIETLARVTNGKLLVAQMLVGLGLGLVILGGLVMAFFLRTAYLDGELPETSLVGDGTPSHLLAAPLVVVGLLVAFYFWGRQGSVRRLRNATVILLLRQRLNKDEPATSRALPNGVTEQEIVALMKRIDTLMAQLPDSAVTEFSKSREADTYLKLLGP